MDPFSRQPSRQPRFPGAHMLNRRSLSMGHMDAHLAVRLDMGQVENIEPRGSSRLSLSTSVSDDGLGDIFDMNEGQEMMDDDIDALVPPIKRSISCGGAEEGESPLNSEPSSISSMSSSSSLSSLHGRQISAGIMSPVSKIGGVISNMSLNSPTTTKRKSQAVTPLDLSVNTGNTSNKPPLLGASRHTPKYSIAARLPQVRTDVRRNSTSLNSPTTPTLPTVSPSSVSMDSYTLAPFSSAPTPTLLDVRSVPPSPTMAAISSPLGITMPLRPLSRQGSHHTLLDNDKTSSGKVRRLSIYSDVTTGDVTETSSADYGAAGALSTQSSVSTAHSDDTEEYAPPETPVCYTPFPPSPFLEDHTLLLPLVQGDYPPARISSDTLRDILSGEYKHMYNKVTIIDCRFEFEFNGGHINGAHCLSVNYSWLTEFLFNVKMSMGPKHLLIFHCEFSQKRAPTAYRFIRNYDRRINVVNGRMSYPEMYVLDAGYKKFFETSEETAVTSNFCSPPSYTAMVDPRFSQELKEALAKEKTLHEMIRRQSSSTI